jgi:hypothetical protein
LRRGELNSIKKTWMTTYISSEAQKLFIDIWKKINLKSQLKFIFGGRR